jgi:hypothetical protein
LAENLPADEHVRWRLSRHADEEIRRRAIPLPLVEETLMHPRQVVAERGGLRACQSQVVFPDGRAFLLRVIVDDAAEPTVVVTAYRTSKIDKYWRAQ